MTAPSAPDILDRPLAEAAAAVRAGRLGAVELTEACLARAQATSGLGAFALLDAEGARRQAEARARELEQDGPRGPLHGVPVAVKDVFDVAGLPTVAGSAVPDRTPAARDAPLVARLRGAGAVIVGKTTTHELAFGVTTPAVANPHDPARTAGGSSGGSAVAVATGAVFAALGSDTAGSVRLPAAFCGVCGVKARPGALPMDGAIPLAPSMDSAGVLARTPDDLATVWTALTGEAVARPAAAPRVGVPDPAADAEPEIAAAAVRAAAVLASGAPVAVAVPPAADWSRPRGRMLVAEALDTHRRLGWYPARRQAYGEEPLGYLRAAGRLSDEARAAARRALDELARALRGALERVDVLVLPTCPVAVPARDTDPLAAAQELTVLCGPASGAGLPAASVPWGSDRHGMPIGVQIVGRTEVDVLSAALRLADEGARR